MEKSDLMFVIRLQFDLISVIFKCKFSGIERRRKNQCKCGKCWYQLDFITIDGIDWCMCVLSFADYENTLENGPPSKIQLHNENRACFLEWLPRFFIRYLHGNKIWRRVLLKATMNERLAHTHTHGEKDG